LWGWEVLCVGRASITLLLKYVRFLSQENNTILMDEAGFTFYLAFHLKNNLLPVGLWLPHPRSYNISMNFFCYGSGTPISKLPTPVVCLTNISRIF
jgi:hypothetical protein